MTRARIDFRKLAASPARFREALLIDTDAGARPLAECLDGWQRDDFAALDPAWQRAVGQPVESQYSRAWLERPRGHSKTQDIGVQAAYALFAAPRKISGIAAAADKDQARLLRDAIDRLVRLNPWLAKYLEVKAYRVSNPHTGSELEIISSDAATSYGHTPDFIIADEVSVWQREDLWASLLSSAAKRSHCLLLCILNAGFQNSWQWRIREAIRDSAEWYFHSLPRPMASWISEATLAEQERLLPAIAFRRLWLNEWGSGSGDAIEDHQIKAALTLDHPPAGPEKGWQYLAALDLGLSRDATALAIIGRHVGYSEPIKREEAKPKSRVLTAQGFIDAPMEEEIEYRWHEGAGRYRLAALRLWKPGRGQRVSIEAVEKTIRDYQQRYNLCGVAFDPWQAQYLAERLRKSGIHAMAVDFTANNLKSMATATLEAFGESNIDLFPQDQLLADLRSLRVEEKSYGVRLTSPRGPSGHGDAATAVAIGLHAFRAFPLSPPARVDGPLVCWP